MLFQKEFKSYYREINVENPEEEKRENWACWLK
jgi:hypothetical protein